MCRQGGYHDQAVFLAKKHGEHDLVVDILIEDSKRYDEALDYIWRLEPDLAYVNLMKYARVLLEHCPKDATQLFIDYYTRKYRPKKDLPNQPAPAASSGIAIALPSFTSFIPLAYRPGVASPATAGTQPVNMSAEEAAEAEAADLPLEYDIAKPRTAFSAFVDHPQDFIVFLEACLKQEHIEEGDRVDLYTALFEMYLETARHEKDDEKREWEAKAKSLIESKQVSLNNLIFLTSILTAPTGPHRRLQHPPPLPPLQLPRRDHPRPRTARPSLRHLSLLHLRLRHRRRHQSPPQIRARGAPTLPRRSRLLHLIP